VERLCTYVAIVDRGRIVRSGTVAEVADGGRLEQAFFDAVSHPGAPVQVHDQTIPWSPIEAVQSPSNENLANGNLASENLETGNLENENLRDLDNCSEDELREMAEVS
jgi:ABC-type multidrug transport system ATPase subunit